MAESEDSSNYFEFKKDFVLLDVPPRRLPLYPPDAGPKKHANRKVEMIVKGTNTLLYDRKETARLLGIGLHKLDELIRRGEIDVRRIDHRIKIHHTEVDRFAQGPKHKPGVRDTTTTTPSKDINGIIIDSEEVRQ